MVQLGLERFMIEADELHGQEREDVWPEIVRMNPRQAVYAKMTERRLPVVYLRRV